MGWQLHFMRIAQASNLDTSDLFGHEFKVQFDIRYTPDRVVPWVESPYLRWKEKIFMVDHAARQYWQFEGDMARYYPNSRTLAVWMKRYIVAHTPDPFVKGWVRLTNPHMQGVDFPPAGDNFTKAELVRSFLASRGGTLDILIHDIPAIRIRRDSQGGVISDGRVISKERLLTIEAGVSGNANRVMWSQYLRVDSRQLPTQWTRTCTPGPPPALPAITPGYMLVPAEMPAVNTWGAMAANGEYL